MVPILVILTIAALLLLDFALRRRRARIAEPGLAAATAGPTGSTKPEGEFFLHPGLAWARVSSAGAVTAGSDALAAGFAGGLAAVEVPEIGRFIRQGAPAWTLVSSRGRRLVQPMPIDGVVVETNAHLATDPALVQKTPYEAGWILRVRPNRLAESLSNLLSSKVAGAWRDAMRSRLHPRPVHGLGALAQDGGEPAPAFGDLLTDEEWERMREELFPVKRTAAENR